MKASILQLFSILGNTPAKATEVSEPEPLVVQEPLFELPAEKKLQMSVVPVQVNGPELEKITISGEFWAEYEMTQKDWELLPKYQVVSPPYNLLGDFFVYDNSNPNAGFFIRLKKQATELVVRNPLNIAEQTVVFLFMIAIPEFTFAPEKAIGAAKVIAEDGIVRITDIENAEHVASRLKNAGFEVELD